ncbi:MAG: tetratricopeptide repeat protein [Armatimonadota bacterium]
MTDGKRKLLAALVVVIVAAIVLIQLGVSPKYEKIVNAGKQIGEDKSGDMMAELPGQFIVASFTGFKQVVAGALWIRADEFFHRGQYHAIVPMVRMVTWLDPHNIDVYITGAWHLDYNFVDEANTLSDKRYIPASIAFMKEGIRNNPTIWDLYFELGWTHYSKKLMDNEMATRYIAEACKYDGVDPNTGARQRRPGFVDRMKAHMLEKTGRLDEANKQWNVARQEILDGMEANKKNPGSGGWADPGSLDLCDRNQSLLLMRQGWRYADMAKYEQGLKIAERVKSPEDWVNATRRARQDFESRKGKHWVGDAQRPLEGKFEVTWLRASPRVLVVKGTCNIIQASEYKGLASESFTDWYASNMALDADKRMKWRDGSRVYWRLQDLDYEMPDVNKFNWNTNLENTVAWGDIYVGGGSFSTKIDMSDPRDRGMYPLKAEKYKLTVWMDPVEPGMPDFVQDRVGWRGEALVDDGSLDTTTRPGYRMLKKEFILSRSDII